MRLAGALLLLAGLGGCAQGVASAQATTSCPTIPWGGWTGEPRCAALAARPILGRDRACTTDADCALVHAGASCREQAASVSSVTRYRAMDVACTAPTAGPCNPAVARCASGCCVANR